MTRWEYLEVSERAVWAADDNDWLNKLGQNGWELVSVDNGVFYFRRPKQMPIGPSETKEVPYV